MRVLLLLSFVSIEHLELLPLGFEVLFSLFAAAVSLEALLDYRKLEDASRSLVEILSEVGVVELEWNAELLRDALDLLDGGLLLRHLAPQRRIFFPQLLVRIVHMLEFSLILRHLMFLLQVHLVLLVEILLHFVQTPAQAEVLLVEIVRKV